MEKLSNKYDIEKIKSELFGLINEHGLFEDNQLSLQSPTDDWYYGCGWVSDKTDDHWNVINTDSNFEITKFLLQEKLVRTRVLLLHPKTCYTYHKDRTPRVHLAINTDPACYHVTDKTCEHIPSDGYPYLLDTTQYHTAFNGTKNCKRIHLVGCQLL